MGYKSYHLPNQLQVDVSNFFKALGNDTRLGIAYQLMSGEKSSSELAKALEMTNSAISHQLTLLKQLNVVRSRREGKQQIYSLADNHISNIIEMTIKHYSENGGEEDVDKG